MPIPESAIKKYSPVNILPGIGAKKASLFEKLGLKTVQDLLYFFPRDYEDWSERHAIRDANIGQWLTLEAIVVNTPTIQRKGRLTIIRARLEQDGSSISATWFNQPWIQKQIKLGKNMCFMVKSIVEVDFLAYKTPIILRLKRLISSLDQFIL